jgi:hypothetical protein
MKTIVNTKELPRLDGTGTMMVDRGEEGQEPASVAALIYFLIIGMPVQELKMGDVHTGNLIISLVNERSDTLDLENSDFDWLKKAIDNYAPRIFGMNAIHLADAIKRAEEGEQKQAVPLED